MAALGGWARMTLSLRGPIVSSVGDDFFLSLWGERFPGRRRLSMAAGAASGLCSAIAPDHTCALLQSQPGANFLGQAAGRANLFLRGRWKLGNRQRQFTGQQQRGQIV